MENKQYPEDLTKSIESQLHAIGSLIDKLKEGDKSLPSLEDNKLSNPPMENTANILEEKTPIAILDEKEPIKEDEKIEEDKPMNLAMDDKPNTDIAQDNKVDEEQQDQEKLIDKDESELNPQESDIDQMVEMFNQLSDDELNQLSEIIEAIKNDRNPQKEVAELKQDMKETPAILDEKLPLVKSEDVIKLEIDLKKSQDAQINLGNQVTSLIKEIEELKKSFIRKPIPVIKRSPIVNNPTAVLQKTAPKKEVLKKSELIDNLFKLKLQGNSAITTDIIYAAERLREDDPTKIEEFINVLNNANIKI